MQSEEELGAGQITRRSRKKIVPHQLLNNKTQERMALTGRPRQLCLRLSLLRSLRLPATAASRVQQLTMVLEEQEGPTDQALLDAQCNHRHQLPGVPL